MKRTILASFVLLLAICATHAPAAIQLGFLVDDSGSIGSGNFNTIRTAMSTAMANVLPIDSSVEVSVVKFSNGAVTIVSPTVINSQPTLDSVVNLVANMSYVGGGTNLTTGLNTLTGLVTGSPQYQPSNPDMPIIYNIVTDGVPNNQTTSVAARNAAIAAGVDEIDAEFIGSVGSSGYNFLLDEIVYPQPGTLAPPFNPGFVIAVSVDNFEDAFTSKLQNVIQPPDGAVPEPGSVFVFAGLGLLAVGYRRWNRRPS